MDRSLEQALARALGARVLGSRPLTGGDINAAYAVELEGGSSVFVKTHPGAPRDFFAREAQGLEWLREGSSLRVPKVLAVSQGVDSPAYLVLELIARGRPGPDFDERLGRGLAELHRSGAPSFGFANDNFIGSLPQENTPCETWAEFYRARRLEPQLRRAVDANRVSLSIRRAFERLFARLPALVGPAEPPARLHGDLWGGNLYVDERGEPCLIDPAVYGGHREVDLAMMRLFGGFSERVFAAYAEAYPLAAGAPDRVALYQLYPLLVHANLFGGSYVASVERALARYV